MPGQYLVVLRQGTHESHVHRTIRRLRNKAERRGYMLEVMRIYSGALHGFLVKMASDVLHLVTASFVSMLCLPVTPVVVVNKGVGNLLSVITVRDTNSQKKKINMHQHVASL